MGRPSVREALGLMSDGKASMALVLLSGDLQERLITATDYEYRDEGLALTLKAVDGNTYEVLIRRKNDPRKVKPLRS